MAFKKPETTPTLPFSMDSDWGKCVQSFLQSIYDKSGSQSSHAHYKGILMDFLGGVNTLPDLISREEIERYLCSPSKANGREGPIKYGTRNHRLSVIRSLFRFSAEYAVLDEHGIPQPLLRRLAPTTGIRYVQREKPPHRSLSEEQLSAFFKAIPTDTPQGLKWRAFFLCAFWTAARRAVLCGLRWGDIQQATIREPGHAPRPGYIYHWNGSKGHSRQSDSAEMPAICVEAIRTFLEASGRLATIQPGDPIWTADPDYIGSRSYDPQRPINPMSALHACKRFARRAGIPEDACCVHSFRHSSALHRYLCGQGIFEIKTALRHSSLDMTAIYLSELAGQADSLPPLMSSKFGNL